MAVSYFARLYRGLCVSVDNLTCWRSLQSHTALRVALACALATFFAMWLQADQPYWACISAFVVVQTFVGNTLQKAIMRFLGTALGALLGLIITSIFIQQHVMMYLSLFLSCFVGIYLSCVDKEHMYVWLLGYITLMMIVFGGIADPSSEHFIAVAFNRSFEVTIGIVASLLVTYLVLPRHAKHTIQRETILVAEKIHPPLHCLMKLYLRDNKKQHEQIETAARDVIAQIERCQNLWQMGEQEGHREAAHLVFRQVNLVTRLHTIFDLLLDQHRALADFPHNAYLALLRDKLKPCLTDLEHCFSLLIADIATHHATPEPLQKACDQFDAHWQQLVTTAEALRKQGKTLAIDIAEVDAGFQALLTLHMMAMEIRAVISPPQTDIVLPLTWRERFQHAMTRALQYDSFYVKHAFLGACALLFMPLVWLFFNLPGFGQIAISIGAVIGMNPENTRYKGFLRIAGCGVGLALALCMLALDIQNLGFLLFVVFSGTLVFAYFHYDKPEISYFGTQVLIVFFIGTIASLSPTTDMTLATERLAAIIIGVASIVLFQHVFWRFRGAARTRHNIHQFQCAAKPLFTALQYRFNAHHDYVANTEASLAAMRTAIHNLREPDPKAFALMLHMFYRTYFLVTLVRHGKHLKVFMALDPRLAQTIARLFEICVTPNTSTKESSAVLKEVQAFETLFITLRQHLREKQLLRKHDVGQIFEVMTLLSTLRAITTTQKRLLTE